jgi:predicted phosphate transport protein (TIGR00153 family)
LNFTFLPVEVKFYDYFQQASEILVEGATTLQFMLDHMDQAEELAMRISEIEHKGDQVVHEVTNLLPKTLITPIDSEDIQRLINTVDDALDAVNATAQRLLIYKVKKPTPTSQTLARLIVECAKELKLAFGAMSDKKQYAKVREHIVRINTLENEGDIAYYAGLKELVAEKDEIFNFIRWKEIYELLESTTDRIEDTGDVIQKVIIGNA